MMSSVRRVVSACSEVCRASVNGPSDVISTCDKPRDEWTALICYIPRFLLYACNASTIHQFVKEGKYKVAWSMVVGTAYYGVWYALVAHVYGAFFALDFLNSFKKLFFFFACVTPSSLEVVSSARASSLFFPWPSSIRLSS